MSEEKNSEKKPEPETFPLTDSAKNIKAESEDRNTLPGQQLNSQQTYPENEYKAPTLPAGSVKNLKHQEKKPQSVINPSNHKHHSKKWKDYLFEFLLLFLAVTAGFFVDNKREYYIEHQRADQFSKQLLADLRLDSLLFENMNRNIRSMQRGHDTLLNLLTKKINATDKQILQTLLPLAFVFDIPATTTTYNQMKTSGSLRYIENMKLTALLQDYYDVLLPRSINIARASLDYYSETISPYYLKHIRIQDYDPFNDTLLNKNPVIMERTKQTNQELANIMGTYRSLLKIQVISMNDPALKKIKETIAVLKTEYNLE